MSNTGDRQVVVNGMVFWQALDKTNALSGKYQIDICRLGKKDIKALEDIGLEVRVHTDKDGKPVPKLLPNGDENLIWKGRYVTPKANRPVTMVDEDKKSWDCDKLLGNRSIANVCIRAYDYDFKGKQGVAAGLQAVQVMEHVDYNPAAVFEAATSPAGGDDVPF
jgi:hypothetical protein